MFNLYFTTPGALVLSDSPLKVFALLFVIICKIQFCFLSGLSISVLQLQEKKTVKAVKYFRDTEKEEHFSRKRAWGIDVFHISFTSPTKRWIVEVSMWLSKTGRQERKTQRLDHRAATIHKTWREERSKEGGRCSSKSFQMWGKLNVVTRKKSSIQLLHQSHLKRLHWT